MQTSGISWCNCTWNPITGCSMKCKYCYARDRAQNMAKIPTWPEALREAYSSFTPTLHEKRLREPKAWKDPQAIFVGSMGELFDSGLSDDDRARVLGSMTDFPRHTYLLLSKRPDIMAETLIGRWMVEKNWRLGFTATDQKSFDYGIKYMLRLANAGWKIFVSFEPMLGPITVSPDVLKRFSGVILGGQTGKRAEPLPMEWVRNMQGQCEVADVPFHFKQWGEYEPRDPNLVHRDSIKRIGKNKAGRTLDGRVHDALGWELTSD